jgi:diaminopimelate decarboxylase
MLLDLIDELRDEHGFEVERLEYGPGLGVPLFEGDDFSDTLAPAHELASTLREVAARVELTVEMGRFFATECGTYFTSVNDVKTNEDTNYCIVDGGINHLTYVGQIMGMKVPVLKNLSAEKRGTEGQTDTWCICGSLCTTNDVLSRAAEISDVREGDVLAFFNSGAYSVTEGVYLFLSRTMPRVIMRNAEEAYSIGRDFTETSPFNTVR